jgi:hypothetical protein
MLDRMSSFNFGNKLLQKKKKKKKRNGGAALKWPGLF